MFRETFSQGEIPGKVEFIGENLIKRLAPDIAKNIGGVSPEEVEAWYKESREAQAEVLSTTAEHGTDDSENRLARKLAEIYQRKTNA